MVLKADAALRFLPRSWASWGVVFNFSPSFPCGNISQRAESQQESVGCPGVILGSKVSWSEPGVEFNDPGGSLLTQQHILWFCDSTAQTAVSCLLQGKGGNCTELVLSSGSASWTVVCPLLSHVTVATEMAGPKAKVNGVRRYYVRCQRAQEGTACGSSKAVLARGWEERTALLWRCCMGSCCCIQTHHPCRRFFGVNPKFLWAFASESSVVFKSKTSWKSCFKLNAVEDVGYWYVWFCWDTI